MTSSFLKKIKTFLFIVGPGLIVMLADTEAGSLMTAVKTGATFGYKMLPLQIILVPILYLVQELTIRLGVVTRMGHAELIRYRFGKFWAWFSVGTLMITCIGAIACQFVGLAGAGELFGVPDHVTIVLSIIFLMTLVCTGSYRSVERWAIFVGLFELIFIAMAFLVHPSYLDIKNAFTTLPPMNASYFYLAAANIGAVIMPWMIFYQQSAVLDKNLGIQDLKLARLDTAIGAVITQVIMIAVMVVAAATISKDQSTTSLETVVHISQAIVPHIGISFGRFLFGLGVLGASLIATIVVSLTAAWSLGEITGYKRSLEHCVKEAPWFYLTYALVLLFGFAIIESGLNLVNVAVAINVMNAILLPVVVGFLYALVRTVLPKAYRPKGGYAIVLGVILLITTLFGLFSGILGSF